MVLVGPSGLRQVDRASDGGRARAAHRGHDPDRRPRRRRPLPGARDIAMVFQSYALYPHMTVRKNLAFPLRRRRMERSDIDRRVAEVAEMLELDELLHRKPAQLSGGQRQRVAMGRALIREPVAFLLDEPLSNLDAKLRSELRAELKRLHAAPGDHDDLRHPRPGRGDDARRPDRRHARAAGSSRWGGPTRCTPAVQRLRRPVRSGSPAMNLLPGDVRRRGTGVTIGIRPGGAAGGGRGAGRAVAHRRRRGRRAAGSDVFVHGRTDAGDEVVARLPGNARVAPGERVALAASAEEVHRFDAESGDRIEERPTGG